jgi:aryl-alcohol dehydrogenase-like predicted oxidoreductase
MSDLERRQLGRTVLSATVLGFGAMDLGGRCCQTKVM